MRLWIPFAASAVTLLAIASFVGTDWDLPPVDTEQIGYRGTGMYQHSDRENNVALQAANVVPESPWDPDPEGDRAGDLYENVQVLGHLSDDQFNHFMAAITEWISPEEGCNYCHNPENLASDEVYTKVVARRMIQMNQAINANWKPHVGDTGVTCYTCHRGNHIPQEVWSRGEAGQNMASKVTGSTSLPTGALESYLLSDTPIRVHSDTALPDGTNKATTKETEATWGLMMHMSESLGQNCVACHNSRAFNDWDQSPPQRVTAWHGIRMVRAINNDYLEGLAPVFPANRLGPEGDVLKVNCATCHNGVNKPLYGASMLQDYVDSLATITNEAVPDFADYEPGVTQRLAPAQDASLESESETTETETPAATGQQSESPTETQTETDTGDRADSQPETESETPAASGEQSEAPAETQTDTGTGDQGESQQQNTQ